MKTGRRSKKRPKVVSAVDADMARKVREGLAWAGVYPVRELDDGFDLYVQRARGDLAVKSAVLDGTDVVALWRATELMVAVPRDPHLFAAIEAMDIPVVKTA